VVATYARADAAIVENGRVRGVRVTDVAPGGSGSAIDVPARLVVNATGPQADRVLARLAGEGLPRLVPALSLGLNIVTRPLGLDAAVGGSARGRLFFVAPWRGVSIAGTSHEPYDADADAPAVPGADLDTFLRDLATAFPRAGLTRADVRLVHRGLLPSVGLANGEVQLLKTSVVRDHAPDGRPGLLSVVGTRYTTARHTAQVAVDRACAILGVQASPCATATTPLPGAQTALPADPLERLYGRDAGAVRALATADSSLAAPLSASCATLGAEIVYGVREEMAITLADAILRRTEAGVTGHPGPDALARAAAIMASELRWDAARTAAEIDACARVYDVP
jgi:glycerol-3-phosphate dehydrogenase